jgi:hypothetical protein
MRNNEEQNQIYHKFKRQRSFGNRNSLISNDQSFMNKNDQGGMDNTGGIKDGYDPYSKKGKAE